VRLDVPGGQSLTLDHRPDRIVSLSPAATETLFAIGADKQVVAVDDQSDYPPTAPHTSLSGLTPNVEAIAAYKPDLVVASADPGGLVAGLGKLQIKSLILPSANTLDDAYAQMTTLGKATGQAVAADTLVSGLKTELGKLVAATPKPAAPLTYYHELSQDYYSANSKTFVGQVYGLFGLVNVADSAPSSSGYPQLSAEALVKADPKLIFLADTKCCAQDAAAVAKRPGFSAISAVKSGNVVKLDDDIASRWGPRLLDFAKAVAAAVTKAAASGS
jgi:iron complex transport system substrate-binding protein